MVVLLPMTKSPFVYTLPSLPTFPLMVSLFWKFSCLSEKMEKAKSEKMGSSFTSVCMVRATARAELGVTAVPFDTSRAARGFVPAGGGQAMAVASVGGHVEYSCTVTW